MVAAAGHGLRVVVLKFKALADAFLEVVAARNTSTNTKGTGQNGSGWQKQ